MSRDRVPSAIPAHENIGKPFLSAVILTVTYLLNRRSTGYDGCIPKRVHFVIVIDVI